MLKMSGCMATRSVRPHRLVAFRTAKIMNGDTTRILYVNCYFNGNHTAIENAGCHGCHVCTLLIEMPNVQAQRTLRGFIAQRPLERSVMRYLIAERISRSSAPFAMHSVARPSAFAVNDEEPPELNEMLSDAD
jgi:MinD superfamily P-loop ATPase